MELIHDYLNQTISLKSDFEDETADDKTEKSRIGEMKANFIKGMELDSIHVSNVEIEKVGLD